MESSTKVSIKGISFDLEIAKSDFEKSKGLMFRTSMPANCGMLFLFNGEKVSFHMKNTFLYLDVVYVDKNFKIVKIDSMVPHTGTSSCDQPIYYVIEFNQGTCKKNNIKVGDFVKIERSKKKKLRESFEDIEKMKLRLRMNLSNIRFLDILTHIRGIRDVITVTADGQLEPAPDGKNMSNLFVRFENNEHVDVESILKQIKAIEGIDIVKVVEYDGKDIVKNGDKISDKDDVVKNQNQNSNMKSEALIRNLVKETLNIF